MKPMSTRYSYFLSKDPGVLVDFISALPFRIELKGALIKSGKKWMQCFVFPDDLDKKKVDLFHKFDIDEGKPSA